MPVGAEVGGVCCRWRQHHGGTIMSIWPLTPSETGTMAGSWAEECCSLTHSSRGSLWVQTRVWTMGMQGRVCKTSWGPTKTLWWGLGSNIEQPKSSKPKRLINEHCVPLRGTAEQKVIILWKQELFTWNTFLRYHIANDNAWNNLSSGEGAVLVW